MCDNVINFENIKFSYWFFCANFGPMSKFTSGEKLSLAVYQMLAAPMNDVRIYLNGLGRGRLTDSWQLV